MKNRRMIFDELKEFSKDKKKLTKKYRSIPEDLETVQQVLEIMPDERLPFSYRINNLGIETCEIKVKIIACKAMKGKGVHSGFRLVYAHYSEAEKITFIELYHKSDKENEDRDRILKHFK